jgi:4a-hydroxytetrahydrobiopterin dehydratase
VPVRLVSPVLFANVIITFALAQEVMPMTSLADRNCVPCRGGVPPLKGKDLDDFYRMLPEPNEWRVVNGHHLVRSYKFPDFRSALAFVNKVGELAEEQGHHPDILLAWGKAEITTWTHAVDGLTESDFILAAKIDGLR